MNILLIEDDDNLRHGLADLLILEGYSVTGVSDGKSASAILQQRKPNFCLLDVMLPDIEGYTLCQQIKTKWDDVPVLMLTARGEEIDRILGFECGADDYVTKPFSSQELLMRIKAIAKRYPHGNTIKQSSEEFCFNMGDLLIDTQALCAYRNERAISLVPREIDLLSLLYEHAGKAVSRDALYDHCWGRSFMPNSRSLDQYIAALRQKIELDPSVPTIILTVRSVGYRYLPLDTLV